MYCAIEFLNNPGLYLLITLSYLLVVVSTVRAFSCNFTILNAFLLHFNSPPVCSQTTMFPQLVAVSALGDWS